MNKEEMKYIDLSHPIFSKMSSYPTDPKVLIKKEKQIDIDNSLLHSFSMGTHTGTHLDAPSHIFNDGNTIDDFPIDMFTGTIIKLDILSFDEEMLFDKRIDGVFFDTGWYKHFNDPKKFYGSERPIIPKNLIYQIVKNGIKIFGCDLPSVDASGLKDKPIHRTLLGSNIIIYESLANLDKIPILKPFNFYGFPFPFKGLDGSPVRAVAVLNNK